MVEDGNSGSFEQMILRRFPSDYGWENEGIVRIGRERDIAALAVGDFKGRCLIFCHGNGETAVSEKDLFGELAQAGVSVICPDYRGYGQSAGELTEAGCYEAAHAAYRFLVAERHVAPDDIFVLGYSLGSAIAVELAESEVVGGLILQAPFLNGRELRREWRHETKVREDEMSFPTSARLPHLHVPVLVIHGQADGVIPFSQGQEVFRLIASKDKRFIPVGGAGHCDFQMVLGTKYIPLLHDFVSRECGKVHSSGPFWKFVKRLCVVWQNCTARIK